MLLMKKFILLSLLFVCLFSTITSTEDEEYLYFVNLSKEDHVVLSRLDLNSYAVTDLCDFGEYPAFRKFNDHNNIRVGSGVFFMDIDYYSIFLHDNVNDRNSGVIKVCNLDGKNVSTAFTLNSTSCDYLVALWNDEIFYCVDTGMDRGHSTHFYSIIRNKFKKLYSIPYHAEIGKGNFLEYNRINTAFHSYLFSDDQSNNRDGKEYSYLVVFPDDEYPETNIFDVNKYRAFFSLSKKDANTWLALMQYEVEEDFTMKGAMELDFSFPGGNRIDWLQRGFSKNLYEAKEVLLSYTTCEKGDIGIAKIVNKEGETVLVKIDARDGRDFVIDTSAIGDLTYVSQFICM